MTAPDFRHFSQRLVEAAERLASDGTTSGVLDRVVELAPAVLPGVAHASISIPTERGVATVAASSPVAREVDAIQYEVDQGPCLSAIRESECFLIVDVAGESRWPRFTSRMAAREGISSMLSVPLRTGSRVAGSLNTSSAVPGVFTRGTCTDGSLFAALASLALAAARERERATDLAAEAGKAQQAEDLLDLLAHDLRSGMTVAMTADALLASRRSQLDARGQDALDLLSSELGRQQRLLLELLDLARDRAEQPASLVPLGPAIRDLLAQQSRPIPVRVQPGAAGTLVPIHLVRLRRILANLLNNADRHAGGVTGVEIGRTGPRVWVAVEDAGPGVPDDARHGLFSRLVPGDAGPVQTGSHLGLALSREHARLAGGDLLVEDSDGGGARFVLWLPAVDL